jgi:hypothetical protein
MKKMSKAMYGKSMMKTGGSATKKKVDNSFAGKLQRGLDYILGSDKLRATASSINKKLDPARDKANAQAKAINKKLNPVRDSANKKASDLNTKIQTKFGDPIRKSVYGDKKKEVKKPEVKKPIANKTVVKPITSKVETPKVVKTPKVSTPSVSQLWQQKTGTSWSEAKKQGLSDGSAKSNMALMKKLQSGQITKSSLSNDTFKKEMEKQTNTEITININIEIILIVVVNYIFFSKYSNIFFILSLYFILGYKLSTSLC